MIKLFKRVLLMVVTFGFLGFGGNKAMIVFDASGSMWGQIGGKAKIAIAKDALKSVVQGWSEAKKKESIKEIDNYIKAIPCIKGAKSMNELQGCMAR